MTMHKRFHSGSVLVVDDDPGIRRMVRRLLIEEGYEVLEAASGVEAITLLDSYEDEVRLVLLDLALPGMDGVGVMRHLVNVHHVLVGVIIITGYSELLSREDFFALGTDTVLTSDYIMKPFSSAQLVAEVEKAFDAVERKRKAQQKAAEDRIHTRLENIESVVMSIHGNQRGFLGELGMEIVKVLVVAAALLLLLYFGVDDFSRKLLQK